MNVNVDVFLLLWMLSCKFELKTSNQAQSGEIACFSVCSLVRFGSKNFTPLVICSPAD